jgi:hypothetical protein
VVRSFPLSQPMCSTLLSSYHAIFYLCVCLTDFSRCGLVVLLYLWAL